MQIFYPLQAEKNATVDEKAELQSQERFWQAKMKSLEQSHQQELDDLMEKLAELRQSSENAKKVLYLDALQTKDGNGHNKQSDTARGALNQGDKDASGRLIVPP